MGIIKGRKTAKNPHQIIILQNRGSKKGELRGCVFGSYKLVWYMSSNQKKLYSLGKEEILVENYTNSQKELVQDMTKFILAFLSDKSEESESEDLEILRSLGYIQ